MVLNFLNGFENYSNQIINIKWKSDNHESKFLCIKLSYDVISEINQCSIVVDHLLFVLYQGELVMNCQ